MSVKYFLRNSLQSSEFLVAVNTSIEKKEWGKIYRFYSCIVLWNLWLTEGKVIHHDITLMGYMTHKYMNVSAFGI